jgi:hypothetical protein
MRYAQTCRLLPADVLAKHMDGFLCAARAGGDVFARGAIGRDDDSKLESKSADRPSK